jgi:hypothetical protein
MKKLEGDFYYWPISLRTNVNEYFKDFKFESINNFLVPIESIYIPDDIKDLKYVPNCERIFFLRDGYSKTIYSQYFPNSNNNKVGTILGKLYHAKGIRENNFYDKKEFSEYTILKLSSTKKNIFTLAKSEDEFFIIKVELSSYGLLEKNYYVNKIVDRNMINDSTNIEISLFDISDFESYVFINPKKDGKIYVSKFRSDNDNLLKFDCILIKSIKDFYINTFSIQNLRNEFKLCVFDSTKKILIEFNLIENITGEHKIFEITNTNFTNTINEEKVENISHYSISTQHLNKKPPLIQETINLLILQSKRRILVFDLHTKKYNVLIGNGPVSIDSLPDFRDNLNDYQLGDTNYLYAMDHNGIIFGNPSKKRLFLLMSSKCRELYYFSGESQVTKSPMKWDES